MHAASAFVARSLGGLGILAAFVLLRWLVDPLLGFSQSILFVFPAVYLIGRRYGPRQALLWLAAGLITFRYLFFPPRGQFAVPDLHHQCSLGISAVLGLVMIWASEQRRWQVDLLERKERLLRNLIDAQEHEKQSVAHDIHDGLLQHVIGARMLLESLLRDHPATAGADVIDDVQGYLAKAIEEGRQVIRGVRPPMLDDLGLEEAIKDLAVQCSGLSIGVEHRIEPDLAAMPPSLQTTICRVVQEALNNARKHSGSDRAVVSLRRCAGAIRLEVEDFGRGFDVASTGRKGFGLIGMTERVRLAGGTLWIDSRPGHGTRVSAELPWAEVDAPETTPDHEGSPAGPLPPPHRVAAAGRTVEAK